MSVPGLYLPVSSLVIGVSVTSNTPFNVLAAIGGITTAVRYLLFVPSGVIRGSDTLGVPSIDASGLHADSVGLWFIDGDISARGGEGAGQVTGAGTNFYNESVGGGGGGAGAAVGAGGVINVGPGEGTDGSPGTSTTGGAAGTNATLAFVADDPISAEDGGDAIWTSHAITAVVNGDIHGGGGGGGWVFSGGSSFTPQPGGDLDQPGSGTILFGAAGNAVRLFGASASFTVSSGAGFVGTVSA